MDWQGSFLWVTQRWSEWQNGGNKRRELGSQDGISVPYERQTVKGAVFVLESCRPILFSLHPSYRKVIDEQIREAENAGLLNDECTNLAVRDWHVSMHARGQHDVVITQTILVVDVAQASLHH